MTTHYCETWIDDSRGLRPDQRRRFQVLVEGVAVDGYDPVKYGICGAHWKAVEVEVRDSLLEIVVVPAPIHQKGFCPFEVERLDP